MFDDVPKEIFAERTLERDPPDTSGTSGGSEVVLRLFHPVQDRDNPWIWVCQYQIIGLGPDLTMAGLGSDALDALLAALKIAAADFKGRTGDDVHLTWLGDDDLGLPSGPFTRQDAPDS